MNKHTRAYQEIPTKEEVAELTSKVQEIRLPSEVDLKNDYDSWYRWAEEITVAVNKLAHMSGRKE